MSKVITFYGVRGSVPSPITAADVERKVRSILQRSRETQVDDDSLINLIKEEAPLTFGGNTSCVEIESDGRIFVLDMGTGLRTLGNKLFQRMMAEKGLFVDFFVSHVHWDHIQGLPFFGPLYMNKETGINNHWRFYGGTNWQETAQVCLAGQMDPPTFPVSWAEIIAMTAEMTFWSFYDRFNLVPYVGGPKIIARKLNHPQETYGMRFEFPDGKIVAYTTDNEPHDPTFPDPPLIVLAKDADVWITDCQYTRGQYNGNIGGVPRHGWGHSYPEAVATRHLNHPIRTMTFLSPLNIFSF
jgi:phosphoribosyl 1,2-cyclic phosphodiesterase